MKEIVILGVGAETYLRNFFFRNDDSIKFTDFILKSNV